MGQSRQGSRGEKQEKAAQERGKAAEKGQQRRGSRGKNRRETHALAGI
jgi:hypothetical protein